jgi:hypothetical protein
LQLIDPAAEAWAVTGGRRLFFARQQEKSNTFAAIIF